MKVVHFFIHIFSVLVYLTIGSLLVIMALHIVSIEDVFTAVRDVYGGFWNAAQTFGIGVLFIVTGLVPGILFYIIALFIVPVKPPRTAVHNEGQSHHHE